MNSGTRVMINDISSTDTTRTLCSCRRFPIPSTKPFDLLRRKSISEKASLHLSGSCLLWSSVPCSKQVCSTRTREPTRLWYCYGYLVAALANTISTNIYLAVPKRQYKISRKWSATVTFPSILISTYFVAQYGLTQTSLLSAIAQITVIVSCVAIATCAGILVFQRISHAPLRRVHTGR
jgi:hypothetical protein